MDTTFFRLQHDYKERMTGFFEVDFPTVIEKKQVIVQNNVELNSLAADKLKLVPADLRNLEHLYEALKAAGIVTTEPIIFYSECVVNYLKSNE